MDGLVWDEAFWAFWRDQMMNDEVLVDLETPDPGLEWPIFRGVIPAVQ
jgi:hypothetical protein